MQVLGFVSEIVTRAIDNQSVPTLRAMEMEGESRGEREFTRYAPKPGATCYRRETEGGRNPCMPIYCPYLESRAPILKINT